MQLFYPFPRLYGKTANSLLRPNLSVVLIGWEDHQCFDWLTFSFLSILVSPLSVESSKQNLCHILFPI